MHQGLEISTLYAAPEQVSPRPGQACWLAAASAFQFGDVGDQQGVPREQFAALRGLQDRLPDKFDVAHAGTTARAANVGYGSPPVPSFHPRN